MMYLGLKATFCGLRKVTYGKKSGLKTILAVHRRINEARICILCDPFQKLICAVSKRRVQSSLLTNDFESSDTSALRELFGNLQATVRLQKAKRDFGKRPIAKINAIMFWFYLARVN